MKRRTFLELTGLAAGGAALGLSPDEQVAEGLHGMQTEPIPADMGGSVWEVYAQGIADSIQTRSPVLELMVFDEEPTEEEAEELEAWLEERYGSGAWRSLRYDFGDAR